MFGTSLQILEPGRGYITRVSQAYTHKEKLVQQKERPLSAQRMYVCLVAAVAVWRNTRQGDENNQTLEGLEYVRARFVRHIKRIDGI